MKNQIAKLVSRGDYKKAIEHFKHLRSISLQPIHFTFPFLLKACLKVEATHLPLILHAHMIKLGLQTNIHTATALTHTYLKLNLSGSALKLLDEIPDPNIALLNAAISGFSQKCHFRESFKMFRQACLGNTRPDSVSIASALCRCDHVKRGEQLHCWAIKIGAETDIYAATSILTMYLNCADLLSAKKLFTSVDNKNVVSYNAYMSGLLKNRVYLVVLNVFKEMMGSVSEKPNSVTLISVLCACGELKSTRYGRQFHGIILKLKLSHDVKVATALVDMYSKCGSWKCASEVFVELGSSRNLVTWNAMIGGLMLNDQSEPAIELFVQMQSEGFLPDSETWNVMISGFAKLKKEVEAFIFFRKLVCAGITPSVKLITILLSACSGLSDLRRGKEIQGYVVRTGNDGDVFITTALMDMYMKCGHCNLARSVFDQFETKPDDPAFWNAMISGYGRNGESEAAFEIFDHMLNRRLQPNKATFNCVLSVCSHSGQVDKGWQVFRSMIVDYKLNPTEEQLNVMVDLLGRSGRMEEAEGLLLVIPEPSASIFASLLGACKYYSEYRVGEEMAKRLSEVQPENPLPYLILSNIYADQGKWEDVKRMRDIIDERGLKKLPGCSSIAVT